MIMGHWRGGIGSGEWLRVRREAVTVASLHRPSNPYKFTENVNCSTWQQTCSDTAHIFTLTQRRDEEHVESFLTFLRSLTVCSLRNSYVCYAFGCAYLTFSDILLYAFCLRIYRVHGEHDVGRLYGSRRGQTAAVRFEGALNIRNFRFSSE